MAFADSNTSNEKLAVVYCMRRSKGCLLPNDMKNRNWSAKFSNKTMMFTSITAKWCSLANLVAHMVYMYLRGPRDVLVIIMLRSMVSIIQTITRVCMEPFENNSFIFDEQDQSNGVYVFANDKIQVQNK